MPAKLRTALVSAGAVAVTAVAVLGTATPAFAKSDVQLSGPSAAHVHQAFPLTILVGDDGGVRPASARLQVKGARGRYQWFGTWHRLHRIDRNDESYTFRVTENRPAHATFRVVVRGGYAVTTNPLTVVIR